MIGQLTPSEEDQLRQTIEMFEVITESQPQDVQSLEILKEAYLKLARDKEATRTSKRIAEAYMQLGQLSSAILEYETILQSHPDDPDVQKALVEIETKATSLTARPSAGEADLIVRQAAAHSPKATENRVPGMVQPALEDGRKSMFKIFVESKFISTGDFDLCWVNPPLHAPPGKPIEPFVQVLADKNIKPLENSLKLLCDKSRLGYIPLERYDVDMELARSFPKDTCQRWCVLPYDRMSKAVLVATANPFNQQAVKEITEATKLRVIWYISSPIEMVKYLKKIFR
jgi:tetratricopeptide (TPR) repeat protein